MEISAKVIACSQAPQHHLKLTTLSLVYPRFIHSEFMTHRVFSRNAMSSRAVPVAKMIEQVRTDPAMPVHWGANQPGMQASGEVDDKEFAEQQWRYAAAQAANIAGAMNDLGLHKQVVNRILEPFQWMHTIVTATEWENFFSLRLHPDAEPNMRRLAEVMKEAMDSAKVVESHMHLPFITEKELDVYGAAFETWGMISAARCARVSYLTHDGSMPDMTKDLVLANKLRESRHASPFEHQAVSMTHAHDVSRNFRGWSQFRERLGL